MARHNKQGRSAGEPRWVQLPYWILETPAALSLSGSGFKVLIYLIKRHNGANNGRIAFGSRSGCFVRDPDDHKKLIDIGLGMKPRTVSDALFEIEAAGFIRCTQASTFDQKRLAREWRLTWLPAGKEAPTKDFLTVGAGNFKRPKAPKKQKPERVRALSAELQSACAPYVASEPQVKEPYRAAARPMEQSHRARTRPHLVTIASSLNEPEERERGPRPQGAAGLSAHAPAIDQPHTSAAQRAAQAAKPRGSA